MEVVQEIAPEEISDFATPPLDSLPAVGAPTLAGWQLVKGKSSQIDRTESMIKYNNVIIQEVGDICVLPSSMQDTSKSDVVQAISSRDGEMEG